MKKLFLPLVLLAAPMALPAANAPAGRCAPYPYYDSVIGQLIDGPPAHWNPSTKQYEDDPACPASLYPMYVPAHFGRQEAAAEPDEPTTAGAVLVMHPDKPLPWIPIGAIAGALLLLFAPRILRALKPVLRVGGWLP
jgi:hypothetical protein